METAKIKLREIRDFGTVISDSFAFIKQEFQPLFRSVLLFAGIFILATGIFSGITNGRSTIWDSLFDSERMHGRQTSLSDIYNLNYFIALFCSYVSQISITTIVACYMKLYNLKKDESPTSEEVWATFRKYIFPVTGITFLLGLLILLGCALCLIPGIYLLVLLAPAPFIIVMEDDRTVGIFGRCNMLIKENFWSSFGLYFVLYMIYAVCAGIIGIVIGLIAGLIGYFTTKDIHTVVGLIYGILSVTTYCFIIIVNVGVGLNYFSLEEKTEGTGLMEKINEMDNDETDTYGGSGY